MISNACTRIDIGASAGSVPCPAQPSLTCGVSDDVIQVSITSGSGTSSPEPHDGQELTGGLSASGSTRRASSRARTRGPDPEPNQTGPGTPPWPPPRLVPVP